MPSAPASASDTASFKVERRVGRVVEARVFKMTTEADVAAYSESFAPLRSNVVGRPVLCADHRPVAIYPQAVADRLTAIFTSLNTVWDRVAILVAPTNATLAMQLQRIVRESKNPSRKVFFEASEASAFLREVLDATESARVATFLDERVPSSRK